MNASLYARLAARMRAAWVAALLAWLALLAAPAVQAQALGLATEGGLGLAVTTLPDAAPAGWGLHLYAEPRLVRTLGLRAEAGLTLFDRLCFAAALGSCPPPQDSAPLRLLSGSVAASLFTPPFYLARGGRFLAVGIYAGREIAEAWRGERNCLNCRTATVGLRGGFYAEPAVALWSGRLGVGAGLRLYEPRADLHRRLTVRLLVR